MHDGWKSSYRDQSEKRLRKGAGRSAHFSLGDVMGRVKRGGVVKLIGYLMVAHKGRQGFQDCQEKGFGLGVLCFG